MPLGKQEILQTTVEGKNCLYEVYGRFSSKTCEQNYYLKFKTAFGQRTINY